ncbi:DUF4279 domain-containing protein [Aliikangiella maris]|uniref:DUF4279 domain-containing protein n=2 Tax=Aliikangiella maris TaxID=3162458 RepID=A0ABV2BZY1_9GAMM
MGTSKLICMISHPTIAPENITENLKLKPYLTQKFGSFIVTPKGNKPGGKYKVSKWAYSIEVVDSEKLNNYLCELVEKISREKLFIDKIIDEKGEVNLIFSIAGVDNLGFNISAGVLEKIAKMKINIGFEFFSC